MEILQIFNKEKLTDSEVKLLRHRRAVRAVVFDSNDNIALLHAKTEGYYELPGGGVDTTETYEEGITRECKEEIGCTVKVVNYIGTTLEYRKQNNLLNETWGYIAKVIGDKGLPVFIGDENEAEKNSTIVWVSLIEAIKLMKDTPKQVDLYQQYCIDRDLTFLKKV
jgi:8-oxo-dGTP diphosphatase